MKAPVTARGQRTRQQLFDAAEAVFAEKGFEGASIVDITQGAGVALGTFYVYFPNKQSLYSELVDQLGSRLRRVIAEAVAGLNDRIEVEQVGLKAFFEFLSRHRNLYRIVRQAEFVDEQVFRAYYEKIADGYTTGLKAAMDQGQIRKGDPEKFAYCLMGIADFVGMRWILWENESDLDQLVEETMAFIHGGIAPAHGPANTNRPTTESARKRQGIPRK